MLYCLRRLNIQIAKERELAYETDVLRGECMLQMENLKRFIPLTRQPGQLGFLEYTPTVHRFRNNTSVELCKTGSGSKQDLVKTGNQAWVDLS
ncbi:hypothetical protein HanOQP8_Chr02g0051381 [Helianthus annuus]|nr:hypothetical protein HanOQP8_Chr02g0051381 [Helianthus annuus]